MKIYNSMFDKKELVFFRNSLLALTTEVNVLGMNFEVASGLDLRKIY